MKKNAKDIKQEVSKEETESKEIIQEEAETEATSKEDIEATSKEDIEATSKEDIEVASKEDVEVKKETEVIEEKSTREHKGRLMRIKWEITCFVCLVLFGLIDVLTIKYINAHTKQITHGEEYRQTEEVLFPECLVKNTDTYVQYFTAKEEGLSRIGIRLAYNHGEYLENYGATCSMQIKEVNSDKIVFFKEVSEKDVNNWHYYWIFPEGIEKDKEYSLIIKQTQGLQSKDGDFIFSWVPFIYFNEQAKDNTYPIENTGFEYNGETQDYQMDLEFVYELPDKWQIVYLILANLIVLGIFVIVFQLAKTGNSKITYCWAWVLPVPIVVVTEVITGAVFTITPQYWLVNFLCFYVIYGCVLLFLRRMKIAVVILPLLLIAFAILQHFVCVFRGRPFMIQDLISAKTAAQVAKSYTYELPLEMGIALLVAITLIASVILLPAMKSKGKMIIRRLLSVICMFEICVFLSDQSLISSSGIFHISWWDIESSYAWGGYLRTLLAQISYMEVEKPHDYSVQKVKDIAEKNAIQYDMDAVKEDLKSPVNLILIMNESWADFRYINSFEGDDKIMPYMDSLKHNVIKGYMSVPVFGAGTANSEWEALTGNSMANLNSSSVPYQSFIKSKTYGLPSKMKQLGYQTLAMHPHEAANWDRDKAYTWMDFDRFHSIEDWSKENKEIIRWCVSDSGAYREVEKMYEEKEGDKLFTFLVTMQNHGGYDLEYDSTVNLVMKGNYPQAEQYLSLIKETDNAFKELTEYFSKVKEPTIIAMFGDHLPNVEQDFYSELFGIEWDDMDKTTMRSIYVTPYIVWANYPLDVNDTNGTERQTGFGVNGPEMSSNYFGSYLMKWAGLPLSEYDKYLLNMHKKVSIFGNGMMRLSNGKWGYYGGLNDEMQSLKDEYNIMQYNNMFDKKQRVDSVFSIHMQEE